MVQRRDRIEVVAIDPSSAFAKAIREMLSRTAVSVDGCRLVMKANDEIKRTDCSYAKRKLRARSNVGSTTSIAYKFRCELPQLRGKWAAGWLHTRELGILKTLVRLIDSFYELEMRLDQRSKVLAAGSPTWARGSGLSRRGVAGTLDPSRGPSPSNEICRSGRPISIPRTSTRRGLPSSNMS
ncbi:hypothetical protein A0W34_13650 [Rhodococcus sp. BH4]|nr:hypothetical protein A0W34_13650 [Rhodococcus sp. BH4]